MEAIEAHLLKIRPVNLPFLGYWGGGGGGGGGGAMVNETEKKIVWYLTCVKYLSDTCAVVFSKMLPAPVAAR